MANRRRRTASRHKVQRQRRMGNRRRRTANRRKVQRQRRMGSRRKVMVRQPDSRPALMAVRLHTVARLAMAKATLFNQHTNRHR
jgi:hypothetical protein